MSTFVSPTGYIDLDNDFDRKATRSREDVNPKEDLAFYFDTYLVPKYGLNNINVNNTASFMKDLEMNWTKLNPELQSKVMDIMVDGILSKNTSFKEDLLAKLGVNQNVIQEKPSVPKLKSNFGMDSNKVLIQIILAVLILAILFVVINRTVKF